MWNKITHSLPASRGLFYLICLGLLPSILLGVHYLTKKQRFFVLTERMEKDAFLFSEKERKEAVNKAVRHHFKEKQGNFVEQQLKSMVLLKKEREKIEKTMKKSSFVGNPFLEERLYFLQGKENTIQFTEQLLPSPMNMQETLLTLRHPVEVDAGDLNEMLQIIEESSQSEGPQFIVLDMQLHKLQGSYQLQLKLLKREFL